MLFQYVAASQIAIEDFICICICSMNLEPEFKSGDFFTVRKMSKVPKNFLEARNQFIFLYSR